MSINIISAGRNRLNVATLIAAAAAAFSGASSLFPAATASGVKRSRNWAAPVLPQLRAEIKAHNDKVEIARRARKRKQESRFIARLQSGLKVNKSKRRALLAI